MDSILACMRKKKKKGDLSFPYDFVRHCLFLSGEAVDTYGLQFIGPANTATSNYARCFVLL